MFFHKVILIAHWSIFDNCQVQTVKQAYEANNMIVGVLYHAMYCVSMISLHLLLSNSTTVIGLTNMKNVKEFLYANSIFILDTNSFRYILLCA